MSRLLLKLLLLPIALLLSGSTFPSQIEAGSDAHIYKGRYKNYSDIIYTWDGKHFYKGRYANYSDILLTLDAPIPAPILLLVVM